ncbi:hypothetical protein ElyMa_006914700 [Elysia marginata]|uniref:Uncharacterized protein n=1 Tax=Elysia marginata TaxID=1093978 RepID=A0AAV4JH40_9GAST|nr:hypothetical protein ElyMa_006914700 [Elysia marginata]
MQRNKELKEMKNNKARVEKVVQSQPSLKDVSYYRTSSSQDQFVTGPVRHRTSSSQDQFVTGPVRHRTSLSHAQFVTVPVYHRSTLLRLCQHDRSYL